jgi:hypothetical protein
MSTVVTITTAFQLSKMLSSDTISCNDPRLRDGFASFGFRAEDVYRLMSDTSITIGGGFAAGYFLGYLDPTSDIDFYVHGGVAKQRCDSMTEEAYFAQKHREDAFHRLVFRQFRSFVSDQGYVEEALPEGTYEDEVTAVGSRLFTTGSNVRMRIHYFKANIHGNTKTLNLIFTDTPMSDVVRKVDISVCACYIWATGPTRIGYYHAYPKDVEHRTLKWVEPNSTHTPRQITRWNKYSVRYGLTEAISLTATEFIERYDELPDFTSYIITATQAQWNSTEMVRRRTGLVHSRFVVIDP